MAGDKKNQHYVPECYLLNWGTPKNKNQVYVYDKTEKRSFPTNVGNIAAERYFYDIDFNAIFLEKSYNIYGISTDELNDLRDNQTIEIFLSEYVEGHYKTFLRNKIDRINQMNAWELNNCFFITKEEMVELSFYMAIQMVRGKSVRNAIDNISDMLTQMLTDKGASKETIDKYSSSPSELPFIQGRMILDMEAILNLMESFASKEWILYYNQTKQPFFTSDNPIVRIPHVKHPFLSMGGLSSKGIEICFPLSPQMVLSMYDGEYHMYTKKLHRKIYVINDVETINQINLPMVINAERWIVSQNNDFSLVQNAMNKKRTSLPAMELHYNGKTYTPKTNNSEIKQ